MSSREFDMDISSLKTLNEVEGKEQYHVKISNRFTAFENLGDNVVISRHDNQFVNTRKHSEREKHIQLNNLQKHSTT
jgi:ABC-type ATPase involved in cell division